LQVGAAPRQAVQVAMLPLAKAEQQARPAALQLAAALAADQVAVAAVKAVDRVCQKADVAASPKAAAVSPVSPRVAFRVSLKPVAASQASRQSAVFRASPRPVAASPTSHKVDFRASLRPVAASQASHHSAVFRASPKVAAEAFPVAMVAAARAELAAKVARAVTEPS
jgi:hypothetical protein